MNYIVLDLEWNQCPTGKERENSKIPFEIIEIGAVKLDNNLKQIDTFSETICPKVYRTLHFKIKEISKISMAELKESRDFRTVVREFLHWCGKDYIFCTWGLLDLVELQRNMQYFRIKKRLGDPLIFQDIQKLFNKEMNDPKYLMSSLSSAVDRLGIAKDRPFHRALNDSLYTCEVMRLIDFYNLKKYYSIDCYYLPRNKEEQIYAKFPTYSKFVSRKFSSRERALMDPEITMMRCSECNRLLDVKIPWFSDNAKIYYALGYCEDHGDIKCKIKIKKNSNGNIYVVKIMKPTNEEGIELIEERKDALRIKRKEKRVKHSTKIEKE